MGLDGQDGFHRVTWDRGNAYLLRLTGSPRQSEIVSVIRFGLPQANEWGAQKDRVNFRCIAHRCLNASSMPGITFDLLLKTRI
jgi:hypothetical protein